MHSERQRLVIKCGPGMMAQHSSERCLPGGPRVCPPGSPSGWPPLVVLLAVCFPLHSIVLSNSEVAKKWELSKWNSEAWEQKKGKVPSPQHNCYTKLYFGRLKKQISSRKVRKKWNLIAWQLKHDGLTINAIEKKEFSEIICSMHHIKRTCMGCFC